MIEYRLIWFCQCSLQPAWLAEIGLRYMVVFDKEPVGCGVWQAFTLRDHDGRFLSAATITTNITVRQETEARPWESKARLKGRCLPGKPIVLLLDALYRKFQGDAWIKAMWGLSANPKVDHEGWLRGIHRDDRECVAFDERRRHYRSAEHGISLT